MRALRISQFSYSGIHRNVQHNHVYSVIKGKAGNFPKGMYMYILLLYFVPLHASFRYVTKYNAALIYVSTEEHEHCVITYVTGSTTFVHMSDILVSQIM